MAVILPKQGAPPIDNLQDASGKPALFNKPLWLALNGAFDVINDLRANANNSDNFVTINGIKVTY